MIALVRTGVDRGRGISWSGCEMVALRLRKSFQRAAIRETERMQCDHMLPRTLGRLETRYIIPICRHPSAGAGFSSRTPRHVSYTDVVIQLSMLRRAEVSRKMVFLREAGGGAINARATTRGPLFMNSSWLVPPEPFYHLLHLDTLMTHDFPFVKCHS